MFRIDPLGKALCVDVTHVGFGCYLSGKFAVGFDKLHLLLVRDVGFQHCAVLVAEHERSISQLVFGFAQKGLLVCFVQDIFIFGWANVSNERFNVAFSLAQQILCFCLHFVTFVLFGKWQHTVNVQYQCVKVIHLKKLQVFW